MPGGMTEEAGRSRRRAISGIEFWQVEGSNPNPWRMLMKLFKVLVAVAVLTGSLLTLASAKPE